LGEQARGGYTPTAKDASFEGGTIIPRGFEDGADGLDFQLPWSTGLFSQLSRMPLRAWRETLIVTVW
jgi:hypothetical protein